MKVTNLDPSQDGEVALYDLSDYQGQEITVTFSAQVKRVGAAGNLDWQINNSDYPSLKRITGAAENTWHSMSGTWTGTPTGNSDNPKPMFYLSTYLNSSGDTTYYIDNFTITVTLGAIPGNLGNWDYGYTEDGTDRNYRQAVWALSEEKTAELKSADSLVLVLSTNPTAGMQLVWQNGVNYEGWHPTAILDDYGTAQNGAAWDASTKTLTITLAEAFADYEDIASLTRIQIIIAYYGGADISALGIVSACLQ
jgi:hypothetical protein